MWLSLPFGHQRIIVCFSRAIIDEILYFIYNLSLFIHLHKIFKLAFSASSWRAHVEFPAATTKMWTGENKFLSRRNGTETAVACGLWGPGAVCAVGAGAEPGCRPGPRTGRQVHLGPRVHARTWGASQLLGTSPHISVSVSRKTTTVRDGATSRGPRGGPPFARPPRPPPRRAPRSRERQPGAAASRGDVESPSSRGLRLDRCSIPDPDVDLRNVIRKTLVPRC